MGEGIIGTTNPIGTLVISGLADGMLYGLLVVGVVLVYQVSAAVNFTYGQYGAIGSLVTVQLLASVHAPLVVALVAGVLAGVVLSSLTQVTIFERLGVIGSSGRDLLVGLGLLLSLVAISETVFGVSSTRIAGLGADHTFELAGSVVSVGQLAAIAVVLVLTTGTYWGLYRTQFGLRVRATSLRPDVAESVGINTRLLKVAVWGLSGAYCTVAALFFANQLAASADYMTAIIITVFVLALLGGPDRYWASFGVAVAYGIFIAAIEYLFGANAGTPATFAVAILVLMLLPAKWVGRKEAERA